MLDKAVDIGSLNVSYLIKMSVLTFPSKNLLTLNFFELIHQPLLSFSPFWEDICLCLPLLLRSGVFEEYFVFSFMGGKFIAYFSSSSPTMWW